MKRTPLKRGKPINRRSVKGKAEALLRQEVYQYLVEHSDGKCGNCGKPLNWHWTGFEMHHKVRLSQGGKTDIKNCELICQPCHLKEHDINATTMP